jgi:hypothetical protein
MKAGSMLDFTGKPVDVYPPNRDFPGGVDLNIGMASCERAIAIR